MDLVIDIDHVSLQKCEVTTQCCVPQVCCTPHLSDVHLMGPSSQANEGLVPPATAVFLLGKGGAILIVLMLFMAVTSSGARASCIACITSNLGVGTSATHPCNECNCDR